MLPPPDGSEGCRLRPPTVHPASLWAHGSEVPAARGHSSTPARGTLGGTAGSGPQAPARRGRNRQHSWVERAWSQRTRGTHAVCGAGVTARGQQDSLGGRTGSGPRGAAGTAAHRGSLGAGSFCPHPSAGCSRRLACAVTEVCASLSPFLWVFFLFFQCKEPRQGVWGQQRGRPDHCPSHPPPAALTRPVTTGLAIVSQSQPEKDFLSSTQQSHFLFSPRNSPGPASSGVRELEGLQG